MGLRYGLIGCGEIGRLRADGLVRTSSRLTAASDIDLGRAQAVAGKYGASAESDWRALVRRTDLDAIIVSTPPSLHAEMTIEALESGKHVICEKPLARTPEECREMARAAARSGLFLATGFNYRFYPSIRKAREFFDSGIIGELDHIRSYTGYSATEHNHPWLHDAAIMGGGALRDNGIHLIDTTRYFLGDAVQVQGFASGSVWQFSGCEDNGFALLRNKDGKLASLQASWTEWRGYRFSIEIYGTLGAIRATCFPMVMDAVWAAKRGGPVKRKKLVFPFTHFMEHLRSYRWVVVQSFVQEFHEFEKAIRGEQSAVATGLDGLRAVEIAHTTAQTRPHTNSRVPV